VLPLLFFHFNLSFIDCIINLMDFSNTLVDLQGFGFNVHEFNPMRMIAKSSSNLMLKVKNIQLKNNKFLRCI
jgi:hypothetical protein